MSSKGRNPFEDIFYAMLSLFDISSIITYAIKKFWC